MTPKQFLEAVWPSEGLYCLATPYKIPNTNRTVFTHKVFDDLDAAAQYADNHKNKYDFFFAVHTLKQEKVWNPEKYNYKTDELGAYEVRKHSNMAGARCFFFDLDVEPGHERKYHSQKEALADLIRFCREAGFPQPLVTSSGGGLHVYWIVEDVIEAQAWKNHAIKLRQVARHYGLKFDPARTTDVSSVLRVVGTFNLKQRDNPRPVRGLTPANILSNKKFLRVLNDAAVKADVVVNEAPNFFADIESNMTEEFTGPPPSMKAVLTACAQMRYLAKAKGNVSEPEWYHSINLVRFLENGDQLVHKISMGHPNYDANATEAKVAQLRAKNIKPTSCAKLAEVCGEERCEGCIFAGKVKSPIVAARYKDPAPQPVVQQIIGATTITYQVPDPPKPYTRMKDGAIAMEVKSKEGDDKVLIIYQHDLYPIRRLVNAQTESEQHVWRVALPRQGDREFVLDADALYERKKFVTSISNNGIYPKSGNIGDLQDYMIAYISELQRLADADAQCNHLGWTDDKTKFILPDKIIQQDGTAKPVALSLGAQRASAQVHKRGTIERQIELLKFYDRDAYIPNQFFIMAGLGAPLMYATGHHGVIVNATGEAGASKSTSLYTAASFWGQPELYALNGTNNGATVRGRNERVTTLANLPVCVDEITHMAVRDTIDLAMSITQPGHRVRLTTEGVERSSNGGYKATIMLTTANTSLHNILSTDNSAGTAGSMRVVEIQFKRTIVHSKGDADEFLHGLRENYGHLGEVFIAHVLKHQQDVERRVRDMMRFIDNQCNIQPSERFWSAKAAVTLVATEIAVELGLVTFNVQKLIDWFINVQIPYMRGVVVEEYASPLASLADYLEHINNNILVVTKTRGFGTTNTVVTQPPRGELLARYDLDDKMMWVSAKGFKDWCVKNGVNHRKVIEELSQPKLDEHNHPQRVITSNNIKKVLGTGTEFAKAQSRVFAVNMAHKDVSGTVDLHLAVDNTKPDLKVV